MKILYSIIAFLFIIATSQAQVQRIPLHEGFTSSTCGPCAPGNANLDAIYATAPHKQIILRYQMSWPGTGDPYYTAEGNTRRNYYNINSVPRLEVDGAWDGNSNVYTAALRDSAYNRPAYMTIDVEHEVRCNQVDIDVTVKTLQAFSGTNVLHIAIVEKETYNNEKTNGETEFAYVMKKMVPDANGTSLGALANGDSLHFTFSHTFPGNYRLPPNANNPINNATEHSVEEFFDLEIVAFVQNTGTKDIHQATYGFDLINTDAAISQLTMPSSMPINGTSIQGMLQNWQDAPITSADIFYSIDGGAAQSMSLTGINVPYGVEHPFTHNVPWTPAAPGQYNVKVWNGNINGIADEVACNDTISTVVTITPTVTAPQADFTWGGSSLNVNFTNTSLEDSIATSSYFWDYGDGSAPGFLENPSHTYASAGTYNVCLTVFNVVGNDQECQDVTVPLVGLNDLIEEKVAVFPNPATDFINVENGLGEPVELVLINPLGETAAVSGLDGGGVTKIDLKGMPAGVYFLEINASGVNNKRKIIIE